jgi:pimeloyl-CoA synthetase
LIPEEAINLAVKQKKTANLRKKLSNQRAGKGSREIFVDDKIDINEVLEKLIKNGK